MITAYYNWTIPNLFCTVLAIFNSYLVRYPAPKTIGYLWNFGFLIGVTLSVQIISGLWLAMFYTAHVEYAFWSVDYIMSEVQYGWIIRYLHLNGASVIFIFVYLHLFRALYYDSYIFPRSYLWVSGICILFLFIITAFLGYVLPWGQMSFWAATVITNFITVIPLIGESILYWVWGGYSVNNATLNRFFCLHYLLPFLILILMVLHLYLLHEVSSSTEFRLKIYMNNKISFFSYYILKDFFFLLFICISISYIIFYTPEVFNHSINYIPADYVVTPTHIVPEWYFLPFYAILRCIPNKLFGIILMLCSILVFVLLPFIDSILGFYICRKRKHKFFFFFLLNFFFLGFLGSQTVDLPCEAIGCFCTCLYFKYLLFYTAFYKKFFF